MGSKMEANKDRRAVRSLTRGVVPQCPNKRSGRGVETVTSNLLTCGRVKIRA